MYGILSFNTKYLYLYLYVSGYSCPNGWTEWAEILKESLEYPGGNKKNQNFFFINLFLFHGQRWALQLVINIFQKYRSIISFYKY